MPGVRGAVPWWGSASTWDPPCSKSRMRARVGGGIAWYEVPDEL
jgi:hypothetical protein